APRRSLSCNSLWRSLPGSTAPIPPTAFLIFRPRHFSSSFSPRSCKSMLQHIGGGTLDRRVAEPIHSVVTGRSGHLVVVINSHRNALLESIPPHRLAVDRQVPPDPFRCQSVPYRSVAYHKRACGGHRLHEYISEIFVEGGKYKKMRSLYPLEHFVVFDGAHIVDRDILG